MSQQRAPNGDLFEIECDAFDATRMSRPDPSWRHVDAAGHEHRWHTGGQPAGGYDPLKRYDVPTLVVIVDYPGDDENPAVRHSECKQCGEHVDPGTCADTHQVFVPGLRHFILNGRSVDKETFVAAVRRAWPNMDIPEDI